MLQPTVRRTWAPKGETPLQRQWERHDRLSVISAITLAPCRRRFGLYWRIQDGNIHGEDVVRFLQLVRRGLRRNIVVILDRGKVHKATVVRNYVQRHSHNIRLEELPAYAPDLNPTEQVWNHTKYTDLPNLAPDDLQQLHGLVRSSLSSTRGQSRLLRSFFDLAGLPP
jgi:transposase